MPNEELSVGMARLKYQKGRTVNLGNFESSRIDIGIELDSSAQDIPATFERMRTWVEKRLAEETKKVSTNG